MWHDVSDEDDLSTRININMTPFVKTKKRKFPTRRNLFLETSPLSHHSTSA